MKLKITFTVHTIHIYIWGSTKNTTLYIREGLGCGDYDRVGHLCLCYIELLLVPKLFWLICNNPFVNGNTNAIY